MTEETILKFVSESFRSIWPLELLVLLSQAPQRPWKIDDLVRELRASMALVSDSLQALEAARLVSSVHDDTYRIDPISAEHAEIVRELIQLYSRKPRAVIRALYSEPTDRMQTFANAFRLRKDK